MIPSESLVKRKLYLKFQQYGSTVHEAKASFFTIEAVIKTNDCHVWSEERVGASISLIELCPPEVKSMQSYNNQYVMVLFEHVAKPSTMKSNVEGKIAG